jgi:hypothetical protein
MVGECASNLLDPPTAVKVRVGEEVDVHMTEEMGTSGSLVPMYPSPTSSDAAVLQRVALTDGGQSATFLAEAPGTAMIMTSGLCLNTQTFRQTFGACPVLAVTVIAATSS